MTFKILLASASVLSLSAFPAFAQTAQPAPAAPSTMTAPATAPTPPSAMALQQKGQYSASKLPGVDVRNSANEKIGDISELIVDSSGRVTAVIIGVGGFLGMGEHNVAVPFAEVKWIDEPVTTGTTTAPATTAAPAATTTAPAAAGTAPAVRPTAATMARAMPDHVIVNMTAEQLKAAPAYTYAK